MKNVDYYLSKGYDRRAAEYFASGRKKIVSVLPEKQHSLMLTFSNGEIRRLNMEEMIQPGTVFDFLSDDSRFQQVYLDENGCAAWDKDPDVDSTICWSNKVDISSDSCYLDSVPIK